jgi:signal transduction histidine kinase
MLSHSANSTNCPAWRRACRVGARLTSVFILCSLFAGTGRYSGLSAKQPPTPIARTSPSFPALSPYSAVVYAQVHEPGPLEKYKAKLLLAIAFIALETTLVVLLILQVRRANSARRMVERRFLMERVVLVCSDRLADCPADKVEGEVRRALDAVRVAKEMDWALWCTVDATGKVRRSLVVPRPDANQPAFQLGENTPWLIRQLTTTPEVAIRRLQDMPVEAAADRAYFEHHRIGSLLALGFGTEKKRMRVLVLASSDQDTEWSLGLIARVRTIGNLFVNALSKRRAEEELRDKKQWLEMALDAANAALSEIDLSNGRIRWSQKDNSLLGKGHLELDLSWEEFFQRVPEADRKELEDRVLALIENRGGGDTIVSEWCYHDADGRERCLLFRGRLYRDARGKPLRLRGVNVDITGLKHAQSELTALTERLIRAQEDERQRLSRELHDDIAQRLSLLVVTLDRLQQALPSELRFFADELRATLEEASQLATDIHSLSHQLHSTKLKHLGLPAALKELCAQMSRQYGIEVKLRAEAIAGGLSEERALCMYRVAQEALQNAAKHSGSATVHVELFCVGDVLRLKVTDSGRGFDVNHYPAGLGLASMRERLRMASGKLQVSSRAGEGTEIVAEMGLHFLARHASAG